MTASASPVSTGSPPARRVSSSSRDSTDGPSTQRLSCEECQRRKSKCDKRVPCSLCKQRGITCTPAFLDPHKQRKKRFPERELLDRIKKYEALLSIAGVDKDQDVSMASGRSGAPRAGKRPRNSSGDSTAPPDMRSDTLAGRSNVPAADVPPSPPHTSSIDPDINHLESILETVTPLKTPVHTPSSLSRGARPSQSPHATCNSRNGPPNDWGSAAAVSDLAVSSTLVIHKHLDLMFKDDGSRYFNLDDHCLGQPLQHPDTSLMFRLLHLYEQNIHPLVRVVHMPSVRERLCDITANPAAANAQDHAIFFAIYTVTIGTLTEDESERLFGSEERKTIWERFRRSTQTALCRADLWRSSSLVPVQALMLYLLTLCKDVDPRTYGIQTGSAMRMAQRLMLYRQASRPSLGADARHATPVHHEMAVRLWWEVLVCDMRACEKSGISVSPSFATATTPLPCNASDADLEQLAASAAPGPDAIFHVPNTECLFILLRAEIAQFQLHPPWSQQHPEHHLQNHPFRSTHLFKQLFSSPSPRTSSLAWRLAAVDAFDTYITTRYFARPETSTSTLVRYAQHHARTWISKIRLFVHLNQRSAENDAEVIRICTVQIEHTVKLIATSEFVRYQWYTYQQLPFFSFVILLDLLRRHTRGELVDQAWKAMESSAVIWRPDNAGSKSKGPTPSSTSQGGSAGGESATPNIYANWTDQNDSRKLQIRGTMLAALLVAAWENHLPPPVAAWEKRAQAVASDSPTGRVPDEPAIVAAMRSAAVKHHAYPTVTGAHETAAQAHSADHQAAYHLASLAAQSDAQWQPAAADPTAFRAFLDPSPATVPATVDDMLNLNSLLQSSIDLDWSGWVHQSWGTPADAADFIPSL